MADGRVTEEAIKAGLDITSAQWRRLKEVVDCLATSREIYDSLHFQLETAKAVTPIDLDLVSRLTQRIQRRLDSHSGLMTLLHQNFSELATQLERAGS